MPGRRIASIGADHTPAKARKPIWWTRRLRISRRNRRIQRGRSRSHMDSSLLVGRRPS